MSDIALRTVGLGKMYRIGGERGGNDTLRDTLSHAVRRPLERIRHPGAATHVSEDLWALKDVDLEVRHGEALGVIGRNGAGKSTLLKVLSRITEPTEGRVEMRGRVVSLLEVGTGFHTELTGRENILLNGAILGMSRAEIRARFDEIVEFSEIGRFLDTPVKRYSSGMYVRLAFAVAAHLDPDVLIIDEVLAVGDLAFQRKCLGRMQDVAGRGRTVLFVSHNLAAIKSMCSRAVLLEGGRVVADGSPNDVIGEYVSAGEEGRLTREWVGDLAPGDEHARLLRFEIRQAVGDVQGVVWSSRSIDLAMTVRVDGAVPKLQVGFEVLDSNGMELFETSHKDLDQGSDLGEGTHELTATIPGGLLNEGRYVVRPLIALHGEKWIVGRDELASLQFEVTLDHAQTDFWREARGGVLAPQLHWRVSSVQDRGLGLA
jgi:lipopolysaccharide transport system ATP-binding protein